MPGMKRDCGGAAAILGAFRATVKQVLKEQHILFIPDEFLSMFDFILLFQGFNDNLHAVFCLAENAVGPIATRPDDIHTLYSGKYDTFDHSPF